jgi:hypothetical protein
VAQSPACIDLNYLKDRPHLFNNLIFIVKESGLDDGVLTVIGGKSPVEDPVIRAKRRKGKGFCTCFSLSPLSGRETVKNS